MSRRTRSRQFDDLPDELKRQILLRLPAKEVMRMRRVSKGWCNQIDDASFATEHAEVSNRGKNLLFTNETDAHLRVYRLRYLNSINPCAGNEWKKHQILPTTFYGGVSGLHLFKIFMSYSYLSYGDDHCVELWNPSLKRTLTLPRCTTKRFEDYALGYSTAFNSYKIIAYNFLELNREQDAFPFSVYYVFKPLFGIDWDEKKSSIIYPQGDLQFTPRPLAGTKPYCTNDGFCYWGANTHVLQFNFNTELFAYLEWPPCEVRVEKKFLIKHRGGSLGTLGISPTLIRVWSWDSTVQGGWVMIFDYPGGWTPGYNFFNSNTPRTIIFRNDQNDFLVEADGILSRLNPLNDQISTYGTYVTYLDYYEETVFFSNKRWLNDDV